MQIAPRATNIVSQIFMEIKNITLQLMQTYILKIKYV